MFGLIAIVAAPRRGGADRAIDFRSCRSSTAGLDRELDENKYIRPGLGDFGDRLYGT